VLSRRSFRIATRIYPPEGLWVRTGSKRSLEDDLFCWYPGQLMYLVCNKTCEGSRFSARKMCSPDIFHFSWSDSLTTVWV
jgi:hypothetical protein